ncbi:MAG: gamma-glutamyltransferase family protein, partial [Gemmatimonadota bacterium]|nr:gamma-glutamyltransferase family protein [Gemmatimonadota bacterium]
YQALIGALDFGMNPQQALELPRFLPGGGGGALGGGRGGAGVPGAAVASPPYNIQLEDGFSPDVIRKIRAMGYDITFVSMRGELREGYGAAVSMDGKTVTAGADPRRAGAAGAVPNR